MENHFVREYAAINPANNAAPVVLRLYCTNNGTWGCAVWVGNGTVSGAGGWRGRSNNTSGGYHKASEAAEMAIRDAGISLSEHISGAGDTAIYEAVKAIAAVVVGDNYILHVAHA
jgi:hypothetical protein